MSSSDWLYGVPVSLIVAHDCRGLVKLQALSIAALPPTAPHAGLQARYNGNGQHMNA